MKIGHPSSFLYALAFSALHATQTPAFADGPDIRYTVMPSVSYDFSGVKIGMTVNTAIDILNKNNFVEDGLLWLAALPYYINGRHGIFVSINMNHGEGIEDLGAHYGVISYHKIDASGIEYRVNLLCSDGMERTLPEFAAASRIQIIKGEVVVPNSDDEFYYKTGRDRYPNAHIEGDNYEGVSLSTGGQGLLVTIRDKRYSDKILQYISGVEFRQGKTDPEPPHPRF